MGICTIGGFLLSILATFMGSRDAKSIISVLVLGLLLVAAIAFIAHRELKGRHRYAQAVAHFHYAAHITKRALCSGSVDLINKTVKDLLNSCAEIFSVVTGTVCCVNVKRLKPGDQGVLEIDEILEDDIAAMGRYGVNRAFTGAIEDYNFARTESYSSIMSLLRGRAVRYYISNNIRADFIKDKYRHPILLDPTTFEPIEGLASTPYGEWPLTFRSTLVVPLRITRGRYYDWVGFLCVDSGSRGVFDSRFAPFLAGAFAELIFLLFRHSRMVGGGAGSPVHQVSSSVPPGGSIDAREPSSPSRR